MRRSAYYVRFLCGAWTATAAVENFAARLIRPLTMATFGGIIDAVAVVAAPVINPAAKAAAAIFYGQMLRKEWGCAGFTHALIERNV